MARELSDDKTMLKLQDALVDTERLGELFIDLRNKIIDSDRRRQELREGLTALRKQHAEPKIWLQRPGNIMIKATSEDAQKRITKDLSLIELQLQQYRAEEKKLIALLADKGVAPSSLGPGMLNAMLTLKDSK
mmetsp:Transcript_5301/g.11603  ORF Transcript_5301/g.11603 Transcript_5301/m.11603 type:complete len:133 (-) Transcript_5301:154-552(-)|eukprot:CAMPEP_0202891512 /NCGR_PEP_ID=MMETSP1392-20130828/1560_1 /ASSEMBLY_ACC=CAM_ASM_000868 /TAXON_ID=225041 /ORGANISM="Chlamydomonas chlamydogama, Strain SAG 11-48b" /LENGTH=132 /DNA_ID=CAMNT_0049575291 /DNA_START=135 /DNA_END=533 /DNA_ORIENTATION=+